MCLLNTHQLRKDLRQCIAMKWAILKHGMKRYLMLEKRQQIETNDETLVVK